jgi:sulfonate transport system ATP-binding protein
MELWLAHSIPTKAILMVTHNIEEAVYLAERIIVFTQKPTKIREEIIVNLSRPRDVSAPEFVKIRERFPSPEPF